MRVSAGLPKKKRLGKKRTIAIATAPPLLLADLDLLDFMLASPRASSGFAISPTIICRQDRSRGLTPPLPPPLTRLRMIQLDC
jgi:hypothetical protein